MRVNSDKPHLLFLYHCSEKENGAIRSMTDVVLYLQSLNEYYITVMLPYDGSVKNVLINAGIDVRTVRFGRWDFSIDWPHEMLRNALRSAKGYLKCKEFLKDNELLDDIDLVYTNTFTVYLGQMIKEARGIPHIWHIREYGWEDHRMMVYGGFSKVYEGLNRANEVVCISKALQEKYKKNVDDRLIRVVYNEIRSSVLIRPDSILQNLQNINCLIAGTLQSGKGQLEAIKAVELLREWGLLVNLYVAGTGKEGYKSRLKQYVSTHRLETCVHFMGQVKDLDAVRLAMDIAVMASSSEAFGRVTVEGMLAGLLVIGKDAAGTSEIIDNGVTGYLYSGSERELALTIKNAVANAKESRLIAERGQRSAIERFASGRNLKDIKSIIDEHVIVKDA